MFVKQLSVFIENREGRLEQVTDVIRQENINILSLSMADTTEYGMLRMVVSDPDRAKDAGIFRHADGCAGGEAGGQGGFSAQDDPHSLQPGAEY